MDGNARRHRVAAAAEKVIAADVDGFDERKAGNAAAAAFADAVFIDRDENGRAVAHA